jgi:uncharacterized membrane-anchored protein
MGRGLRVASPERIKPGGSMSAMKVAPLRHRHGALPGVSGVARLDRRTLRLAARLNPGDIAVIDQVDLDRVAAERLVAAKPAAVINVQPSISGRYPNLGPHLLISNGIMLLDNVGPEIFGSVKEGMKVRVDFDTVYVGEESVASGFPHDAESIGQLMRDARYGLAAQLEAFAVDTGEFLTRERELLVEGVGIPQLRTKIAKRHVVVVTRSSDAARRLKKLKPYIREYKPVLIGVDGGADLLLEVGIKPHVILGDLDAVSDAALRSGAEVVVHARPDGRAPGLDRVQDLGIDAVKLPTSGTSEDAAMLLADKHGAELVVTVGAGADLNDFLDRGRAGMASSFLTRLRLGPKLVDSNSVGAIYRTRISGVALLLLVIAAMAAVIVAMAVSNTGRSYLTSLDQTWNHIVRWVQGLFS